MIEEKLAKISDRLHKAVKIFADEFDGHLSFLNENIGKLCEGNFTDEELRRVVAHRFHTIRGGAGFFQLETISVPSTKGEHLMGKDFSAENTDGLETEVREILSQLDTEFAKVKKFLEDQGL